MLVTQLYLTLCDTIDHSLPGSFVHGISQARTLEWVAISFSRGSRTRVSCIVGRLFTVWATREALLSSFCVLVVGVTQNQVFNLHKPATGAEPYQLQKNVGRMEVILLGLFIREQNSEKKIFKNKRTSLVIQWLRQQHSQCTEPRFNTWLGN